ncbi:hypothetical protein GAS19_02825 [Burkholderia glumae]|uniref:hypothetical protein n=1 Tax=Burkholderia glumae TaxID=337 RepID=UPI0012975AFE|nr:hypothetical protein [Burkholderia glumae]QGA36713.1 hypothetical protein GAS19_02825 [Burkholderia glumae]
MIGFFNSFQKLYSYNVALLSPHSARASSDRPDRLAATKAAAKSWTNGSAFGLSLEATALSVALTPATLFGFCVVIQSTTARLLKLICSTKQARLAKQMPHSVLDR